MAVGQLRLLIDVDQDLEVTPQYTTLSEDAKYLSNSQLLQCYFQYLIVIEKIRRKVMFWKKDMV